MDWQYWLPSSFAMQQVTRSMLVVHHPLQSLLLIWRECVFCRPKKIQTNPTLEYMKIITTYHNYIYIMQNASGCSRWTLCAWPGGTSDTSTLSILSIARAASCQTSLDICLPPCENKDFLAWRKATHKKTKVSKSGSPMIFYVPGTCFQFLMLMYFFGSDPLRVTV